MRTLAEGELASGSVSFALFPECFLYERVNGFIWFPFLDHDDRSSRGFEARNKLEARKFSYFALLTKLHEPSFAEFVFSAPAHEACCSCAQMMGDKGG